MQAQVQAKVSVFKPFTEKSNAKRALIRSFGIAKDAADNFLHEEGGKWGFEIRDGQPYATAIMQALDDSIAKAQVEAEQVEEAAEADEPATMTGFSVFAAMVSPVPAPAAIGTATAVRDGKKVDPNAVVDENADRAYTAGDECPLCGGAAGDVTESNPGVSCLCHGCGKTFSVTTGREIRAGYKRDDVNRGYTIEKNRPVQNGVTRPSAGTLCGQVWAVFDEMYAASNMPVASDITDIATANNWNRNNVSCEFYQWRKFNGIKGRQVKTK